MFMGWEFQPLEISAEYYIWMLPGCRCWRRGAVCVTRSWAHAREFPAAFLYTPAASSEETPPTTARCKWHYEHCKAVDDEHKIIDELHCWKMHDWQDLSHLVCGERWIMEAWLIFRKCLHLRHNIRLSLYSKVTLLYWMLVNAVLMHNKWVLFDF